MLRQGDALQYLRFKETLTESDHEAIFSDGRRQPAYYRTRNGQNEWFVEIDYKWVSNRDSAKFGLLRYEKIPEPQASVVEVPPAESTKLQGSTTAEIVQDAERKYRQAQNEEYANRQGQQFFPVGNSAFADAAHRERQIIAAQKGRRNY